MSLILLVAFLIVIVLLSLLPRDDNDYGLAFFDKEIKLSSLVSRKKIIFVGGSGMAFGLDSSILQKEFPDYSVINMGLHAAVGLEFMLEQIKPYIRNGDIVVLSPEYEQFDKMLYGNSSGLVLRIILDNPRYLLKVKAAQIPVLVRSIPTEMQNNFRRLLRKLLKVKTANTKRLIYHRYAFNEFGDVISHIDVSHSILDSNHYAHTKYALNDFKYLREALRSIRRFVRYCDDKDVSLFYAYPQIMESIYSNSSSELVRFDKMISQIGIKALYKPCYSVMADSLFMDTPHHLLLSGSQKRTAMVTANLRRMITDFQ